MDNQKKEVEVQKRFHLGSVEGIRELSEHVVNEVSSGHMPTRVADPINTAMKVHLGYLRLNQKYLEMLMELYGPKIRAGHMSPEDVVKKLPSIKNAGEQETHKEEQ